MVGFPEPEAYPLRALRAFAGNSESGSFFTGGLAIQRCGADQAVPHLCSSSCPVCRGGFLFNTHYVQSGDGYTAFIIEPHHDPTTGGSNTCVLRGGNAISVTTGHNNVKRLKRARLQMTANFSNHGTSVSTRSSARQASDHSSLITHHSPHPLLIAHASQIAHVGTEGSNAPIAQGFVELLCLGLADPRLQSDGVIAELLRLLLQFE